MGVLEKLEAKAGPQKCPRCGTQSISTHAGVYTEDLRAWTPNHSFIHYKCPKCHLTFVISLPLTAEEAKSFIQEAGGNIIWPAEEVKTRLEKLGYIGR